jgi:hypothetical protein
MSAARSSGGLNDNRASRPFVGAGRKAGDAAFEGLVYAQ